MRCGVDPGNTLVTKHSLVLSLIDGEWQQLCMFNNNPDAILVSCLKFVQGSNALWG